MPVPQKRLTVEKLTQAPRAFAAAFARINRALRLLEAIANMEGTGGIKVQKSESNWLIDGTAVQGTGGGGVDGPPTPFLVRDASAGGVAAVTVDFGTVNWIVPTMGGTSGDPLDADPAPQLSGLVTGPVYLELTLYAADGVDYAKGDVQYAVVKNAAALPTPTATLDRALLATITVSGGRVTAINQSVTASLGFMVCAGAGRFWQ